MMRHKELLLIAKTKDDSLHGLNKLSMTKTTLATVSLYLSYIQTGKFFNRSVIIFKSFEENCRNQHGHFRFK